MARASSNSGISIDRSQAITNMGKAPADQFYFGDYIRDTRCLSIQARGAWSDFLAFAFFETPQGRISQDIDAWSRLFGTDIDTARSILSEIQRRKVGDIVTERNGDITVTNRRKYREWLERESGKQRAKRFRDRHGGNANGESNGEVTPLSSSSTSYSTSFKEIDSYVRACIRAHPSEDARLVEIAVLETLLRRKGSLNEHKPIKSARYFDEEIKTMCSKKGGGGLGDRAIDVLLQRRREQVMGDAEVNVSK
jgi:uncharacterized protein YdaU (DUF1376 family)